MANFRIFLLLTCLGACTSYKPALKPAFRKPERFVLDRRQLFELAVLSAPALNPSPVFAKVVKVSADEGRASAKRVFEAATAMKKAESLAAKAQWDDLRVLLETPPVGTFEASITNVVNAEGLLVQEDKEAIGTIRRYGLAADFLITAGAVRAELKAGEDVEEEEFTVNGKEVKRTLRLANGSIDEIVSILKNANLQ